MNRYLFLTVFLLTPFLSAHHGWSGYKSEMQKLEGTIVQSTYQNPHGTMRLKTGEKTLNVVLAPTSRMDARGLNKEMLKAGTQVAIEGFEKTTDPNEIRAERITVAGKTIELR